MLENYVTGKQASISPAVAQLLSFQLDYEIVSEILRRWDFVPDAEQLLGCLLGQDLLVMEGSHLDAKEESIESKWAWNHPARHFHYATNSLEFECDPETQRRDLSARASEHPPPSPYKDSAPIVVDLDRTFKQTSGEFWDTLLNRRTCRSFSGEPISKEAFADVLLWTWGKTHAVSDSEVGDYVLKTSPSGGARHAIEVYPVVLAVRGVAPGIYHYSVRHNGLVLLKPGAFADLVEGLCSDQAWLRSAAAVFFMTAVVERTMWKYRHSHAYRVLHLDAGHLGQTFHLVCRRLGLGPFTTAATRNEAIERELGLDGVSEIVLYTAAVGVPA